MVYDLHPKKCQVLHIVGKKKTKEFSYTIHDEELQDTPEVKYLGVTLTKDLRWKTHISNICNRANRMLGFLRRNLRITKKRLKDHAYKAFIRPLLEYACPVWDPYYEDDIEMLEKVQKTKESRQMGYQPIQAHITCVRRASVIGMALSRIQKKEDQTRDHVQVPQCSRAN
jgi:hypothetical protein